MGSQTCSETRDVARQAVRRRKSYKRSVSNKLPPVANVVFTTLLVLLGSSTQLRGSCTIGIGTVDGSRAIVPQENGEGAGQIRFKIANAACPSEGSNFVTVSVMPLDVYGTLKITGWAETPIHVPVPDSGSSTDWQVLKFSVSGAGSLRLRLQIETCNGKRCEDLEWDRSPNYVMTRMLAYNP